MSGQTSIDELRAAVRAEIIATPAQGVGSDPFPADGSGFYEPFVRDAPATALAFHRCLIALEKSCTLPHRLLHLIWCGVDTLVTHLFPLGAQMHGQAALAHGATPEQLFETLSIACAVSNRTGELIVPVLVEELERAGHPLASAPLSEAQADTKRRFIERNGFWVDAYELAMRTFPDCFHETLELGHALRSEPALAPIDRALVFLGLAASPPIVDVENSRRYARRALELGADPADVRSAVLCCASLGSHAFAMGVTTTP
jgi:alkylhydroperoxidase/carboxymuconolactone decarboxylase family protein YurZ